MKAIFENWFNGLLGVLLMVCAWFTGSTMNKTDDHAVRIKAVEVRVEAQKETNDILRDDIKTKLSEIKADVEKIKDRLPAKTP